MNFLSFQLANSTQCTIFNVYLIFSLQSGDIYQIKVVEIAPKFAFLGANIDEAVQLQRQHDVVFKQLQVSRWFHILTYT